MTICAERPPSSSQHPLQLQSPPPQTQQDSMRMLQQPAEMASLQRTAAMRRVLYHADLFAHSTTVMLFVLAIARLHGHMPAGQYVHHVFLGPKTPLFSLVVIFTLQTCGAIAALLLLTFRTHTYFKHRLAICLSLRLARLAVMLATFLTPTAVATLATAVGARVRDFPHKATALLMVQPIVYYIQPATILLPWQYTLLFQAISTCAMLRYMWVFPCHLQQLLQPGGSSSYPWQADADAACSTLQSYAALIAGAVGVPESSFSGTVCQGTSSMQALQVFATLLWLFVGPVVVTYQVEHYLSRQQQLQSDGPIRSGSSSSSSGRSASVSSAAGAAGSSWGVTAAAGDYNSSFTSQASSSSRRADNFGASAAAAVSGPRHSSTQHLSAETLRNLALAGDAEDCDSGNQHLGPLALVLVLLLPMVWLLSEFLAQGFEATRDCPSVLAAAGV